MRAKPMRDLSSRHKQAIGQRLALTRQALGLQQNEFADRAGLAANTYNQFETGKNRPSVEAALALKDAYGMTLDWIYDGDMSGLRFQLGDAIKALIAARQ